MRQTTTKQPDVPAETWAMSQEIYVLALTDPSVDSSNADSVIQYCTEKAQELCLNEEVIRACIEYMHPFSPAMQQAQINIDRWIDELYDKENPPIEELEYDTTPMGEMEDSHNE